MNRRNLTLFAVLLMAAVAARAEVKLPKVFSSHMVLQREMPVHVWGDAEPGEQVSVELHGATATAVTDELGRWSVYLAPQQAGGPYTLTVRGKNTVALEDVLVGDLWVASGQSNMEMPLAGFNGGPLKDSEKEIAAANYPKIRLLLVEKDGAEFPQEDVKETTGWSVCTPESARNFSAAAYFFARDLQQKQNVPIGLIDTTWGGSPAEAWTSMDALGADAGLMGVFNARAERMDREAAARRLDDQDRAAKAEGKTTPRRDYHPNPVSWEPAALYNAMIAPLTPMGIKGVIWYQGETNSALNRVELYNRLFPAMITDWRRQWRQGDFPFLFVQISAYASTPKEDWGLLRDAQRRSLRLVNTGMVVTIDVGNETNVHPADKQTVGARLALVARKVAYGEKVTASGPLFRLAYPQQGAMHVWFENGEGLKAQGGAPVGFEVAGADGAFVAAEAKIEGETVVVRAASVPEPKYVRYAWPNFPQANLYNGAGLPASTFTSAPNP